MTYAKVVIDSIKLTDNFDIEATNSSVYFVEYDFPILTHKGDDPVSIEVVRAVSKQVIDRHVSFGHHSVFPLLFDAHTIELWWKRKVRAKVICKEKKNSKAQLIGQCKMSLRDVFQRQDLICKYELP